MLVDFLSRRPPSLSAHRPLPLSPQAIGWIYGYIHSSFLLTFYFWLAGLTLSVVLCVPSWPWYNRNPVEWLDIKVITGESKEEKEEKKKSK